MSDFAPLRGVVAGIAAKALAATGDALALRRRRRAVAREWQENEIVAARAIAGEI